MQPFTKQYKAGSFLFHENDHSRELYIIQSGAIRVFRKIGGREVDLACMVKGAVLGEMALIDGKPRSASAVADRDSSVVIIDADTFHEKIKGVPPWFFSIVRMTSQKIRKANQRLQVVQGKGKGTPIVLVFAHAAAKAGSSLKLAEVNNCIIRLLGVTHQRVLAAMAFLQDRGLISMQGDSIIIADQQRLDEYCAWLRCVIHRHSEKEIALDPRIAEGLCEFGSRSMKVGDLRAAQKAVEADALLGCFALSDSMSKADVLDALKATDIIAGVRRETGDGTEGGKRTIVVNTRTAMRYLLGQKFTGMEPSF